MFQLIKLKLNFFIILNLALILNYNIFIKSTANNFTSLSSTAASNQIGLSQADISTTSSATPNGTTKTLSEPGHYILTSNLSFTAQSGGDNVVIDITADNVTLNLGSFTISSSDLQAGTKAINIATGLSNINIVNGRINKMRGEGIYINSGCSGIHIDNVLINDCDLGGIHAISSNNIYINNTIITNCSGISGTNAFGLKLDDINSAVVSNSSFNNNISSNEDAIGAWLSNTTGSCKNCQFIKCEANTNGTTDTSNSAYGYKLDTAYNIYFESCSANNNGPGSSSDSSVSSYGFFIANGSNNIFQKCYASRNLTTTSSGDAYGFLTNSTTNNKFINCEARDQEANVSGGSVFGFYSTGGTGNLFTECLAHGNKAGTSSSSISAGFAFAQGETRSAIENSKSLSNNGNSGEAYGIRIGQSSGTQCDYCYFDNNRCDTNFATTKQYGIKDFNSNSTCLFTRNSSYGHGSVFGNTSEITDIGNMNYMISYSDSDVDLLRNILIEGSKANLQVFSTMGPKSLENLSFMADGIS